MIYCIDSHIIIWGIKKQATDGQEEMIDRATHFFSKCDEYNDIILIPTVVLAEVLASEPPQIRNEYIEKLSKGFVIVSINELVALKYAELLYNRFSEVRNLATSTSTTHQRMKFDHLIIATAIVNNANCIYSSDMGLKAFAEGYIDVRDLPPINSAISGQNYNQGNLFDQ